ncbi:MAG: hypothetical protein WBB74_12815 [Gaiellaceae bacterium]
MGVRRGALLALVAFVVLSGSGTASGATLKGSGRPDVRVGTSGGDAIFGFGGSDRLDGRGGNDFLSGGLGSDVILGGPGNDRIAAEADRATDTVFCGPGHDIVTAGLSDHVSRDCEVVSRQLSRDNSRGRGAQHETEVEPSSFAWGSTIVVAYQNGRFVDDGAASIGFATSRDGGRTWRSGVLPRISIFATPPGIYDRVADPVVTYDARHRVWLVSSLGLHGDLLELLVSRSRDGVTWSTPVTAGSSSDDQGYDKEWIACDNWLTSPHRGRCYLAYVDFGSSSVQVRRSSDGGRAWSGLAVWTSPPALHMTINGVQPVVQPNGRLVVPFAVLGGLGNLTQIIALRSTDGGATLEPPVLVADLDYLDDTNIRSAPLPSVAVDAGGTVWATWSDCRFDQECNANGIVVTRSSDGVSWSAPAPVPVGRPGPFVDHLLPALAVTGGGPKPARLAVVYYSLPRPVDCAYNCLGEVDAWLSVSRAGRLGWSRPQRLTTHPMRFAWIAESRVGRMLGDYVAVSWVEGRPIPVFALASPPVGLSLRQAIFATTRLR